MSAATTRIPWSTTTQRELKLGGQAEPIKYAVEPCRALD
jgi:hypothetical protein